MELTTIEILPYSFVSKNSKTMRYSNIIMPIYNFTKYSSDILSENERQILFYYLFFFFRRASSTFRFKYNNTDKDSKGFISVSKTNNNNFYREYLYCLNKYTKVDN